MPLPFIAGALGAAGSLLKKPAVAGGLGAVVGGGIGYVAGKSAASQQRQKLQREAMSLGYTLKRRKYGRRRRYGGGGRGMRREIESLKQQNQMVMMMAMMAGRR